MPSKLPAVEVHQIYNKATSTSADHLVETRRKAHFLLLVNISTLVRNCVSYHTLRVICSPILHKISYIRHILLCLGLSTFKIFILRLVSISFQLQYH